MGWEDEAERALRRMLLWWKSSSPERRLGMEEAHEMANVMQVVSGLLMEKDGLDVPRQEDG